MKAFPETNTLFVLPPSIEILEKRLRSRGTDTEETIKTRITNSKSEIEQGIKTKDPSCLIGYRLLNADLDKATKAFLRMFECLYESELKQGSKDEKPKWVPPKESDGCVLSTSQMLMFTGVVVLAAFGVYKLASKK